MENIIEDKSFRFAIRIVNLYKYLCRTKKEFVLSKQLLRAGTSIGANISEAQRGQSKADFTAKMSIALKEAEETQAQLGNLSVQRDLPVTFLQMYARIAQKLGKYQNVPESLIKRYRRILEQFEVLHYNAEHQTMAQGYFEDIRTALKSWENGTP